MSTLSPDLAAEKLAEAVQQAKPTLLVEFYAELFPETPLPAALSASELAKHIRSGLEAEEIVDLWNVVFPQDRNVWYNEESNQIHYNEDMIEYAD